MTYQRITRLSFYQVSNKVIEASLPFPDIIDGGVVVRDDSGHPNGPVLPCPHIAPELMMPRPTGMFLDNAQNLIVQPELTDEDIERRFSYAVSDVVSVGLTSVHDAGLNPMSFKFFARCI